MVFLASAVRPADWRAGRVQHLLGMKAVLSVVVEFAGAG